MRALLPMSHLLPDALRIAVFVLPFSRLWTAKEAGIIVAASGSQQVSLNPKQHRPLEHGIPLIIKMCDPSCCHQRHYEARTQKESLVSKDGVQMTNKWTYTPSPHGMRHKFFKQICGTLL